MFQTCVWWSHDWLHIHINPAGVKHLDQWQSIIIMNTDHENWWTHWALGRRFSARIFMNAIAGLGFRGFLWPPVICVYLCWRNSIHWWLILKCGKCVWFFRSVISCDKPSMTLPMQWYGHQTVTLSHHSSQSPMSHGWWRKYFSVVCQKIFGLGWSELR